MPIETRTVNQAYKYALAPTPRQIGLFHRHAGARRFAYNWAVSQLREVRAARAAEFSDGVEKPSVKYPTFAVLNAAFNQWKKTSDAPAWIGENSSRVYLWAIYEARDALTRHLNSYKTDRRVGFPRYRSRKRDTPRFKMTAGNTKDARPVDSKHVLLPVIGQVRVHESMRKLTRRIANGTAKLKNATISRDASGRWHISFTVEIQREIRTAPSARQRAGGTVGVHLGVRHLATLSTGETIANPRHLTAAERRLKAAQRALSRCAKNSKRRQRAKARLGRLHVQVANQRRDHRHQLTARLVHSYATIAIQDLDIPAMTKTARGTVERPGRRVREKAARNRALLDAAHGETKRHLSYKTTWYGSTCVVIDKTKPTTQTCSTCEQRNPSPTPAERTYRCTNCGTTTPRGLNAARNIAAHAAAATTAVQVAPSGGETLNARRADIRPARPRSGRRSALKREAGNTPTGCVGPAPPTGNGRTSPQQQSDTGNVPPGP